MIKILEYECKTTEFDTHYMNNLVYPQQQWRGKGEWEKNTHLKMDIDGNTCVNSNEGFDVINCRAITDLEPKL